MKRLMLNSWGLWDERNIKQVKYLLGVSSNKDYKSALIKEKNLSKKLEEHEFDISKFWSSTDNGVYKTISNEGNKIKKPHSM